MTKGWRCGGASRVAAGVAAFDLVGHEYRLPPTLGQETADLDTIDVGLLV